MCDKFAMQRPPVMGHEPVLPTPGVPRSLESEAERLAARVLKQSGVSDLGPKDRLRVPLRATESPKV